MPATGGIIAATIGGLTLLAGGLTAAHTIRTRIGQLGGPAFLQAGKSAINAIRNAGKVPDSDIRNAGKITTTTFRKRFSLIASKLLKDLLDKLKGKPVSVPSISDVELALQTQTQLKPIQSMIGEIGGIPGGITEGQFEKISRKLRESTIIHKIKKLGTKSLRLADNPQQVRTLAIKLQNIFDPKTKATSLARLNSLTSKDLKALQSIFNMRMGTKRTDDIRAALKIKFKL